MSASQIIFIAYLFVTTAVALRFGGRDERVTAIVLIAAAFGTPLLVWHGYTGPEVGVILVDLVLFGFLLQTALRSSAFWPLWATGFQLGAVTVHMAAYYLPHLKPLAYADTLVLWSYPVLAALAIGAWSESRREPRPSY